MVSNIIFRIIFSLTLTVNYFFQKRGRKSASPDSLNNECPEEDSLSISSETTAASNAEELNVSTLNLFFAVCIG